MNRILKRKIVGLSRAVLGVSKTDQMFFIMRNFKNLPPGFLSRYLQHATYAQAQHCQDIFALQFLDASKPGYFVEIGVGSGIKISNSYLFEKELGWRGLLCEPHPDFISTIQQTRSAALDTRAAFGRSRLQVDFCCVRNPELSTIQDFAGGDFHDRSCERIVQVDTVSAADLFAQNDVPSHVDFLSIDTEGSEFEILKSLPFNRYSFGFICVEHNFRPERAEIDDFMASKGYRTVLQNVSGIDSWYVPNHI